MAEKRLKKQDQIPDGTVTASVSNGVIQYYLRDAKHGKKRYIPSSQRGMITSIAQREYDKKAYERLLDQRNALKRFLGRYDINGLKELYQNMNVGKKKLITPLLEDDSETTRRWYENFILDNNGFQTERVFATDRGEMVRSKSEKILADIFFRHELDYVYEPELVLGKGIKVFPDFAILNRNTGKTIIWEHLGLIDSGDYATKNLKKISMYEKNGYILGNNLIISTESNDSPLDIKLIEKKLEMFI